jgi:hypothetical protein
VSRIPRELRDLHTALLDAGWTYEGIRRGHHRYSAPEGHPGRSQFTLPNSPSDTRGKLNAISKLRQQGVIVNRRTK